MINKREKLIELPLNDLQKKLNKMHLNKEKEGFFKTYKVTETFIEKNINKLDHLCWLEISDYQELSETFIERHKDKVGWLWISQSQTLGELFIDKYADKLDWDWISYRQKLSFGFILKHMDKINSKYLKKNPHVNQQELLDNEYDMLATLMKSG